MSKAIAATDLFRNTLKFIKRNWNLDSISGFTMNNKLRESPFKLAFLCVNP